MPAGDEPPAVPAVELEHDLAGAAAHHSDEHELAEDREPFVGRLDDDRVDVGCRDDPPHAPQIAQTVGRANGERVVLRAPSPRRDGDVTPIASEAVDEQLRDPPHRAVGVAVRDEHEQSHRRA